MRNMKNITTKQFQPLADNQLVWDLLVKNYNKMPRDMVLVLYCESGGTSLLAAKELYDRGHIVRALVGGFSNYNGKYRVME